VLTQVRALDPTYEKATVEDMLYNARYNNGMTLLSENRLEEESFTWIRRPNCVRSMQMRLPNDNWPPCTSQPAAIGG